jgi:hypothetical protein
MFRYSTFAPEFWIAKPPVLRKRLYVAMSAVEMAKYERQILHKQSRLAEWEMQSFFGIIEIGHVQVSHLAEFLE